MAKLSVKHQKKSSVCYVLTLSVSPFIRCFLCYSIQYVIQLLNTQPQMEVCFVRPVIQQFHGE